MIRSGDEAEDAPEFRVAGRPVFDFGWKVDSSTSGDL